MTTHGHHDPAATSAQPEDAQRPSPPRGTGRPAQAEGRGLRPHPSAAGPAPPNAGIGAVLVAAGSGTRLGRGMPKALVPLAGRPLLSHALDGVAAAGIAGRIVVVLPPGDTELRAVCREAARRAGAGGPEILAVDGGATRNDSVRAGLDALGECRLVLVHDAARCLAPPEVFAAVAAALQAGAAAVIPAVPVVDTVKEVAASGRPGIAPETVASTPARSALRAVQTPQGFRTADLLDAHRAAAGWEAARAELVTDDAMLMELAGTEVFVVPGSPQALKITTPVDLLLAEALLANGYGPAPEDAL